MEVIRYYYIVCAHIADPILADHQTNQRQKLQELFTHAKNCTATILIVKSLVGRNSKESSMERLHKLGDHPRYKLAHYMFVLPLVEFLCLDLNPHNSLDVASILTMNTERTMQNIRSKIKTHSIWSQECMLFRINNDPDHRVNGDAFRGVECEFAQMLSLIIPNITWPFDEFTRESLLPDLTGAERDTMCVGWSQDVVSWHGGPTQAGHPPSHFGQDIPIGGIAMDSQSVKMDSQSVKVDNP